jgi:hypothetical protein
MNVIGEKEEVLNPLRNCFEVNADVNVFSKLRTLSSTPKKRIFWLEREKNDEGDLRIDPPASRSEVNNLAD